jgi:exodeoxyribonuclease VII large subunit
MDRVGLAVTQAFPRSVWVVGEIQNLSRRGSGVFFDLAESADSSQHQNATVTVRTILWSSALTMIAARRGAGIAEDILQDGLKVRLLCQVQLYRDRGQITLNVDDLDPAFTKGALALAREKLLKELRVKGLDTAQKRVALPPFPFLIGLISADNSRAKSDFLDQLQALKFPGEVLFHATPMQGESVPVRVVAALRELEEQGVDLIVVTRGGGSAADLRWFDAPEIAYGIVRCKVPVIAAIGHHEDTCIAELICHERQKTPTAAADYVAGIFLATRQRLDHVAATVAKELTRRAAEFNALQAQMSGRLAAAASEGLARREQRLLNSRHQLSTGFTATLTALAKKANERLSALQLASERALNARAAGIQALEQNLVRRDPTPWLEKGWTQLCVDKKAVRRLADLYPGAVVKTRLLDGRATLIVDSLEKTETKA